MARVEVVETPADLAARRDRLERELRVTPCDRRRERSGEAGRADHACPRGRLAVERLSLRCAGAVRGPSHAAIPPTSCASCASIRVADRRDVLVGQRSLGRLELEPQARATSCRCRPGRRDRGRRSSPSAAREPPAARTQSSTVWASTASSTTTAMSWKTGGIGDQIDVARLGLLRGGERRRRGRSRTRRRAARAPRGRSLRDLRVDLAEVAGVAGVDQHLRGAAGVEEGGTAVDQAPLDAERLEQRRRAAPSRRRSRRSFASERQVFGVNSPASSTPRWSRSSGCTSGPFERKTRPVSNSASDERSRATLR